MDNTQFAALLGVIGTGLTLLGAALRWSAGRIVKALDDNTSASIQWATAAAVLAAKVEDVHAFVRGDITPVETIRPRPGTYGPGRPPR